MKKVHRAKYYGSRKVVGKTQSCAVGAPTFCLSIPFGRNDLSRHLLHVKWFPHIDPTTIRQAT